MAIVEKKEIPLWGVSVANSAALRPDDGSDVLGLLIEEDAGLRFSVGGESEPRFRIPWLMVRGVRLPPPGAKRLDVITDEARHRLHFTDAVIDQPVETAGDGGDPDSFPIEGGARPADQTREERLYDDLATTVGAAIAVVNFVAADRVRRRRVRARILERASLGTRTLT
jgi:hypothetical protein